MKADKPGVGLNTDNLFYLLRQGLRQCTQTNTDFYDCIIRIRGGKINDSLGGMTMNQEILAPFFMGCQALLFKN
jgi:hypothetical protein